MILQHEIGTYERELAWCQRMANEAPRPADAAYFRRRAEAIAQDIRDARERAKQHAVHA